MKSVFRNNKLLAVTLILFSIIGFVSAESSFDFSSATDNTGLTYSATDTIQQYNDTSGEYENTYIVDVENTELEQVSDSNYDVQVDLELTEVGQILSGPPGQMEYDEAAERLNEKGYRFEGSEWTAEDAEHIRETELEELDVEVQTAEDYEIRNVPTGLAVNPDDTFTVSLNVDTLDNDQPLEAGFRVGSNSLDFVLVETLDDAESLVNSVAWSPDSNYLASGSSDDNVYIYSTDTFSLEETLDDAEDNVRSIAFSHDGEYLASGSQDENVYVYSTDTFSLEETLDDAESIVRSLAFSHDGEYLASGSQDDNVYVYSTDTFSLEETLTDSEGIVFSVDWSPESEYLSTGSSDDNTYVYETGLEPAEIEFDTIRPEALDYYLTNLDVTFEGTATAPEGEEIEAMELFTENPDGERFSVETDSGINQESVTLEGTFNHDNPEEDVGQWEWGIEAIHTGDDEFQETENLVPYNVVEDEIDFTLNNPEEGEEFKQYQEVLFNATAEAPVQHEIEAGEIRITSPVDESVTTTSGFNERELNLVEDYVVDQTGTYEWEMEAIINEDNQSFQVSDTGTFEVLDEEPEISFDLRTPLEGETFEVGDTASFEAEATIEDGFEIEAGEIRITEPFSESVVTQSGVNSQNLLLEEDYSITESGLYEWEMEAIGTYQDASFQVSDTQTFNTVGVNLVTPEDGETFSYSETETGVDVGFEWNVLAPNTGDTTVYLDGDGLDTQEYTDTDNQETFSFTEEDLGEGTYDTFAELETTETSFETETYDFEDGTIDGWSGDTDSFEASDTDPISGTYSGVLTSSENDDNIVEFEDLQTSTQHKVDLRVDDTTTSDSVVRYILYDGVEAIGVVEFNDASNEIIYEGDQDHVLEEDFDTGKVYSFEFNFDTEDQTTEVLMNNDVKGTFDYAMSGASELNNVDFRNQFDDDEVGERDAVIDNLEWQEETEEEVTYTSSTNTFTVEESELETPDLEITTPPTGTSFDITSIDEPVPYEVSFEWNNEEDVTLTNTLEYPNNYIQELFSQTYTGPTSETVSDEFTFDQEEVSISDQYTLEA